MHINHILAAGWSAAHDPQQSPNSTIIIAGTQLSPLKARKHFINSCLSSAETPLQTFLVNHAGAGRGKAVRHLLLGTGHYDAKMINNVVI